METLNTDVLGIICEYLHDGEHKQLLIVNSQIYQDVRPHLFVSFNRELSCEYSFMGHFYHVVNSKVPQCKLKLDYSWTSWAMAMQFHLSKLSQVHTLNLSHCDWVTDVSMLGNIVDLNLTECLNVSNVSALGKVKKLNLTGCRKVMDVSALGEVDDLNLTNCVHMTDVSALGKVDKLTLAGCYYLKDVSALRNVRVLSLVGCYVDDITVLDKVKILYVSKILTRREQAILHANGVDLRTVL